MPQLGLLVCTSVRHALHKSELYASMARRNPFLGKHLKTWQTCGRRSTHNVLFGVTLHIAMVKLGGGSVMVWRSFCSAVTRKWIIVDGCKKLKTRAEVESTFMP
ncbi:hypothetical protein ATANTOWER_007579 [Ataeniobius toweri]|uniref:Uncharacterized protein n=1 Tax=Ataeniobius toweri TaxID=208326 RepID=A0ABU7BXX9_9TELE|nr:hypothetical protein [Ataeniobius toweri]